MTSPLVERLAAIALSDRIAVEDDRGRLTFAELWDRAHRARAALTAGAPSLEGRSVAILVSPGACFLAAFLGTILAGGVAVPLSPLYPPGELAWFGEDAQAGIVVVSDDLRERAAQLAEGRRVLRAETLCDGPLPPGDLVPSEGDDVALLLYTSGTTGKPKGAMITHANVAMQALLLREAWGWREDDLLLHALPLHHLHGLGISLMTSVLAGGSTRMLPKFDARRVWDEFSGPRPPSAWMAVPTMYQKLFEAFDAADEATRARWAEGAKRLRIATSGSAALPVTLAERWRAVTGSIPLERFGMTEIGVGMSNPLDPAGRRAGHVGFPLRTVEMRIVDEAGSELEKGPGELWVRGPSIFQGYLGREEATRAAFAPGGWFRTGDVAELSAEGHVRLLGRTSVDILKSGGYKLSALEIEEALRENAAVAEVAVVGVPDETWGDRVVAVVVPAPGGAAACASEPLRAWAKERIAAYKVPREVIVVEALPRNALGKVVKPEVVRAIRAGELR
ncbi:AMP-binding protein [Polyangium aurulentum]|uniref:AMP-binding protein n=1 Tax=Polyangium aurulentum TaxID=2567896 RepID=UPI0010ADF3BF|nr:AMP-binding protein [Polyangium aurulentum]UQA61599.1 AMP-binding protein [Polyangium aurulentum]